MTTYIIAFIVFWVIFGLVWFVFYHLHYAFDKRKELDYVQETSNLYKMSCGNLVNTVRSLCEENIRLNEDCIRLEEKLNKLTTETLTKSERAPS